MRVSLNYIKVRLKERDHLIYKVCLRFAYFAKIENFFVESTVDKGKN